MRPARIAELLEPFLGPSQDRRPNAQDLIPSISTYIDLLLRWNARINLTAVRDPEEIVTRHFGESLFAGRLLFPRPSPVPSVPPVVKDSDFDLANDQRLATNDTLTLADLGSGAGFPGLPIKLWAPGTSLTLIESNHKKAAFLREVTRALTLTNVNVLAARAEDLVKPQAEPASAFDIVTLRAVERFESVLPIAASLVAKKTPAAPGGRLTLLISSAQLDQARHALPEFSWSEPVPVPESRSRVVVIAHRPD